MDILEQVERLLNELRRKEYPKVQRLFELFKAYEKFAKEQQWKDAHDCLFKFTAQLLDNFSEFITESTTELKEATDLIKRNLLCPIDTLKNHKNDLERISKMAQELSEDANESYKFIDEILRQHNDC